MRDRTARTLAALGIAAIDTGIVYGFGLIIGDRIPPTATTLLLTFAGIYLLVQFGLDRLAANNPEDHDS